MEPFFGVSQIDQALLQAVQANADPVLTVLMLFFTFFGNPALWIGIAAALYWRGQENKGFFLMNLVVFASAVSAALKFAFLRPRPSSTEFKVLAGDGYGLYSFPSGHSTLAAAAFSYANKMVSYSSKIAFGLIVLLVAYSRLYLGMHFPSDVVAGLAIGLVIGKANLVARNRLFHKNFKPSKFEDEIMLVVLVLVALLAIIFLRSMAMAGIFLGFYAGFFLFKEMEKSQRILLHRLLAVKYAVGFAVLLAAFSVGEGIVSIGKSLSQVELFVLYLVAGFWISWLWPVLFETAFFPKKKRKQKRKQ